MKKRGKFLSNKNKDSIVIITFIVAGLLALNSSGNSLSANILGISFMIAAVYGIVSLVKNKRII